MTTDICAKLHLTPILLGVKLFISHGSTVEGQGMNAGTPVITIDAVRTLIQMRTTPLFQATDIAYMFGIRNADSFHWTYRPILRILNKMHMGGEIGKYYIAEANMSVFYRLEK